MRSEINAIRARVRALQRKLARELAVYRLDLLSQDLCHRWFVAQSDHKPLPGIQPFINRVIDAGYRLLHWARPTTTCWIASVKTPHPNPKSCSTLSSPLPVGYFLAGFLDRRKDMTWSRRGNPCGCPGCFPVSQNVRKNPAIQKFHRLPNASGCTRRKIRYVSPRAFSFSRHSRLSSFPRRRESI